MIEDDLMIKEDYIKKEYQNSMSQKHASPKLINRTKEAMDREKIEIKIRKKKQRAQLLITLAVAAVVIIVVIPISMLSISQRNQNQTEIHLGNEQAEPGKIERKHNEIKVFVVTDIPEEFMQSEEEVTIHDINIKMINDEESGFLRAYFVKDEEGYVVVSDTKDVKDFLEAVEAHMLTME